MKGALEDQNYKVIEEYVLSGRKNALPASQREMFDRWVAASKLLEKNPVMKNAVAILQAKYPALSRTQAYEDCRNAVRFFNTKKDFDFDLWHTWLLNDIADMCMKAKETGNLKAWAAGHANLIKALGDAPAQDIDPCLIEKNPVVIAMQVNNNSYHVDLNKLLSMSIDQRSKFVDALIAPATDAEIEEIMES